MTCSFLEAGTLKFIEFGDSQYNKDIREVGNLNFTETGNCDLSINIVYKSQS